MLLGRREIDRNDLLEYKEKKINKRVPLVLTYHPSLEKISDIVRHHWKEIQKSEKECHTGKRLPRPGKPVPLFSEHVIVRLTNIHV
jgi:hypothetical protein